MFYFYLRYTLTSEQSSTDSQYEHLRNGVDEASQIP